MILFYKSEFYIVMNNFDTKVFPHISVFSITHVIAPLLIRHKSHKGKGTY